MSPRLTRKGAMGRGPSRRRRRARSERCGLEARVGQRPGSKGPAPGRFVGEAVGEGGGGAEPRERGPLVRGRRARRASKAAVVQACLAAAKARQAQCGGWGEDAKTKVGEEEGERVGVGLGSSDRSGGRRWVVRSRARPPALSPCPRRRRRSHGVEESAMSRLAGSVPPPIGLQRFIVRPHQTRLEIELLFAIALALAIKPRAFRGDACRPTVADPSRCSLITSARGGASTLKERLMLQGARPRYSTVLC
jgi:hypothetical protein